VGHNDAYRSTSDVERCINGSTGLTAGDTQIYETNPSDRITGKKDVAILTVRSPYSSAWHGFQSRGLGQIVHLRFFPVTAGLGVDFLQSYHLGVELKEDPGNSPRIQPTVGTDTLVNIVRSSSETMNLLFYSHTSAIKLEHLFRLSGLN
jgi:hypothetical protein